MIDRIIPFVDPEIGEKELEKVREVILSKNLVEGKQVKLFEDKFSKFTQTNYAIATVNGTAALQLAMEGSPLKPGDEVITTPFTFIATSNSILYTGAIPKFIDVDNDTWNLDPDKIKDVITEKTKGIMPVHIFGLPADMKAIRDIADDYNLFVIEDAAQAHGAKINNKHVGGFGDIGIFSLYVTKNLISGEGGVVTTNSEDLANVIKSLKNHGRTIKGGYSHERVGFNMRMSEIMGAIANIQMDKIQSLIEKRAKNANYYRKIIDEIEDLEYQKIPTHFTHGNYIFAIDTRKHKIKPSEAISKLKSKNILARPIYDVLSYQQQSFKNISKWRWANFVKYPNYNKVKCKIAEDIALNHFEIPVIPSLSDEELEHVGQSLVEIFS